MSCNTQSVADAAPRSSYGGGACVAAGAIRANIIEERVLQQGAVKAILAAYSFVGSLQGSGFMSDSMQDGTPGIFGVGFWVLQQDTSVVWAMVGQSLSRRRSAAVRYSSTCLRLDWQAPKSIHIPVFRIGCKQ